jgi:FkbM family methyltransferase
MPNITRLIYKSPFWVISSIFRHPLNKNHRLSAIFRFFSWQIKSRIKSSDILIEWICGSTLMVKRGEEALTAQIYNGLNDLEEMTFLLHALSPNDIFLDIGANSGPYTVLASKVVGANVVAFEPVPTTFARLQKQVECNKVQGKVDLRRIAIGSQCGVIKFTCDDGSTLNHAISDSLYYKNKATDIINVPVECLDDIFDDNRSYFLKIDVEGYESEVIKGGARFFEKNNIIAVIMELNGNSSDYFGIDESEIDLSMRKMNFSPYRYFPFERKLEEIPSYNSEGTNTIYIRDLDEVLRRIKGAPRRTIRAGQKLEI